MLKEIDPRPFTNYLGKIVNEDLGIKPIQKWIKIKNLRIDEEYQREVGGAGATNIGRIGREFDWSKFGSIIVADLHDGTYAIVDGQHRSIVAALLDIEEVPCLVITADAKQQAAAFAAINGGITAISPLSIFHAEVASLNTEALAIKAACEKGHTTILRFRKSPKDLLVGETMAIEAIRMAFRNHGADILSLALRTITRTRKGNAGLIKTPVVTSYCHVLDAEPKFRKREIVLKTAMDEFDLEHELEMSELSARKGSSNIASELTMRLFNFLDSEIA